MNRLGPGAEHPSQVRAIEPVPTSGRLISTPEEVYDSGRRRMAEYHVDPRSRTAPSVITQSELKVSSEPRADLIVHAREEIDRLYAIVRRQGHVVLLCHAAGVAIHDDDDDARAGRGASLSCFLAGRMAHRGCGVGR